MAISIRDCYISPMKTCIKCNVEKSSDGFSPAKKNNDGLSGTCKGCRAIAAKMDRSLNPQKHRAIDARWRQRHPDQARAKSTRFNKDNPDKRRVRERNFRRNNPLKARAKDTSRRARLLSAGGRGVSATEWLAIKESAVGLCAYCARRADLTMDHIESIDRGGAHEPENIAAACMTCNSSKQERTLVAWLAWRRRYGLAA